MKAHIGDQIMTSEQSDPFDNDNSVGKAQQMRPC